MMPKRSWLSIGILIILASGTLICLACTESTNIRITVITDKTEYERGEVIKVTLRNSLAESVFSHIRSGTPVYCIEYIERKIRAGEWEKLFAQCQPPHCIDDIDAPGEIKPGEAEEFEWEQLVFIDGTSEAVQAAEGIYRLAILYEDCKKTEWKSIYTNEFRIH